MSSFFKKLKSEFEELRLGDKKEDEGHDSHERRDYGDEHRGYGGGDEHHGERSYGGGDHYGGGKSS
jgi:hypothetical protein